MVEILFPLIFSISFEGSLSKSFPSNIIFPLFILALPGNNFKILRADNVFPEPDSPTIATVLPFGISIFTSLTTF